MTVKTLNEQWASYQDEVIPKGAPEGQHVECRRAFFAGAWAMTDLLEEFVALRGLSTLKELRGEIEAFVQRGGE